MKDQLKADLRTAPVVDLGLEEWPICSVHRCDEEFPPKRLELGYTTCLKHGSKEKPRVVIADVSKSNPVISSDPRYLLGAEFRGHYVESAHKDTVRYMRLSSGKAETREQAIRDGHIGRFDSIE